MKDKEVVETLYGTHSKFEVVKDPAGAFSSSTYYVRKDGKPFKGGYSSLAAAVDAAREAAR